jgi:hypothetical protein
MSSRPTVYALQFRGQTAIGPDGAVRKEARAPGGALVTSLTPHGVEGRFVWAPGEHDEARLDSTLTFRGDETFDEEGTLLFARGNGVRLEGRGRLSASRDPHLRHGTVMWKILGGEGAFDGASGLITSNFFLSDTGELTDNQLGVIFVG